MHQPYHYAPAPQRRQRRRTPLVVGIIAVLIVLGGGTVAAGVLLSDRSPATGSASQTEPAANQEAGAAPKAAPRVTDLMKKLGCADAAVIGTQLYSKETGRCKASAGQITVAVFESPELRDKWVDAAKEFGGNMVVGDRWALFAEGPDDAAAAAKKLGGQQAAA